MYFIPKILKMSSSQVIFSGSPGEPKDEENKNM